jgi:hypothetical protein
MGKRWSNEFVLRLMRKTASAADMKRELARLKKKNAVASVFL